ncbi:tyrosine protein phosphatase 1 [Tothia fuscella]|uniref:Tyrosine protein phosphatase 1 n=1 Tax=Tothia fuscella TaxID=1048955 RepID=A0A9P4NPL4_9PEZI|nr:tyrosine protein phosphatase 1 [Tothia fuscella]
MATIVARAPPVLPSRTSTPPTHLTLNTSSRGTPAAVPNKHLPVCSPGPRPSHGLETPPASPPSAHNTLKPSSVLDPPDRFRKVVDDHPVHSIDASTLVRALEQHASQPLPDPKLVFPWLHGLHAENQMQLGFFVARRKALRKVPQCLRGIAVVKAGGDLGTAKLKGAIAPEELMLPNSDPEAPSTFLEIDPKDGFSVRNFQIQACKMATVSDIVVYGDDSTPREEIIKLARSISQAQKAWKERQASSGCETNKVHTFVVSDPFPEFEEKHNDLVAVDSRGFMTGNVVDFFYWERKEMCIMSTASEISQGVFLGPTPDPQLMETKIDDPSFDIFVETSDLAQIMDARALKQLKKVLAEPDHPTLHIEFPSSGSIMPPTWSHAEVDGMLETCQWIYKVTHPERSRSATPGAERNGDGDSIMLTRLPSRSKKVLIHCTDGYTESSLLGLTYFMYAEGLPVHEAWIRLHKDKRRNFFAYPSDVALLTAIQARILQESPAFTGDALRVNEPKWLPKIDGSLPSRILPYMYLGNLGHANNPKLLKEMGITRILSVGEPLSWPKDAHQDWPKEDLLFIDRVQDNGVDPLTDEFGRCLKFIEQAKQDGTATLVHCRVGVSRSATICIAEVMNELGLSFPRAYCFVRARRLNVIIQPHLRFTYELLKWEEHQRQRRGQPITRELEWATIAREIALMNRPYSKQS